MLKPYKGTTTERLYKYFKQFCSNKSRVFPKQTYLASQLGVSTRTIKRAVDNLKKLGIIEIKKSWKINQYSIAEGTTPTPTVKEMANETMAKEIDELKEGITKLKEKNEEMYNNLVLKDKIIKNRNEGILSIIRAFYEIYNNLSCNEDFVNSFGLEANQLQKFYNKLKRTEERFK